MDGQEAFGKLPFGWGVFGGEIKPEERIYEKVLSRIMQRYPHGNLWLGKVILALETAFAREFKELEDEIIKSAKLNNSFLISVKSKSISLPFIQSALRVNFNGNINVFNAWGGQNYRELPINSANQFGVGMFGRSQFSPHYNYPGWNAFNLTAGKEYNGGTIHHICANNAAENEIIFKNTPKNNNYYRRFFFFIGGKNSVEYADFNDYDKPKLFPLELSKGQYEDFTRFVLRIKPLNAFVICNLKFI
jgi:hypothetical protein